MKNYICINGRKIELPEDVAREILAAGNASGVKLAEVPVGEACKIGEHEMIVLDQLGDGTALIRKDILKNMAFGQDNNFAGSEAHKACEAFADEIAAAIGDENIVRHEVDLTSDDGLDDFGKATDCRASLITTEMYRRYVKILDKFNPKEWWWLATAFSIPPHDNDNCVKCVSPSGFIIFGSYGNGSYGVRPFCILKSDIFVSV